MKEMRLLVLWIGMIWAADPLLAQRTAADYLDRTGAKIEEVDIYQLAAHEGTIFLSMEYAQPQIINPENWSAFPAGGRIYEVDLVFTRYPETLSDWEVGFDSLLAKRFAALENLAPEVFQAKNVKWRLKLQTGCTSLKQARECFHGFVIRYGVASDEKLVENFSLVRKYLSRDEKILDSSTVKILTRNRDWENMTVVLDWTASMYANGTLMLLWFQEQFEESELEHLLFFNDGDSIADSLKLIGMTGGIYPVDTPAWDDVIRTMEQVTLGGNGGDHPENNMEAIQAALDRWPDAKEIFLVADNKSPVRDLSLVKDIPVPVHVLVCGSSNGYMHPHYLTIAHQTGGSLHTLKEDIPDLGKYVEGELIQIGDFMYKREGEKFKRMGRADMMDYIWER